MSTIAERSQIAVLQTEMKEVKATLSRIESKLDAQVASAATLLPMAQFDDYKKEVDAKFRLANKNKWLAVGVTVLVTAVVTAMAYALIVGKTH